MRDVILISNRFPPKVVGGAEITVSELALELSRQGKSVKVLSLADGRRASNSVYKGIPVFFMPNFNIYNQFLGGGRSALKRFIFFAIDCFNLLSFFYLLFILIREKPKQVWVHNLKGIGLFSWVAAKIVGAKLLHFAHDYWLICPSSTMFKGGEVCKNACSTCRKLSFFKRLLSCVAPDYFVSVSAYVRDRHVAEGYFKNSIKIVAHNGRPYAIPSPAELNLGGFAVGYIGRIDETKGVDYLFRAARKLGFGLHVAGKDPMGILARLMAEFPDVSVQYYGFVAPEDFYPKVNVTVVPSVWAEPFGNVAFEGWGYGVPSIVFRNGGLPEVLTGMEDLVVDPSDDALAHILSTLMASPDLLLSYRERCLKRRAYFTIERQLNDIMSVVGVN